MRRAALVFSALTVVLAFILASEACAERLPNRIRIEYIPPEKAEHQPFYELMKSRHILEKFQQLFSPFRLPVDLWIKTKTCGMVNAW